MVEDVDSDVDRDQNTDTDDQLDDQNVSEGENDMPPTLASDRAANIRKRCVHMRPVVCISINPNICRHVSLSPEVDELSGHGAMSNVTFVSQAE